MRAVPYLVWLVRYGHGNRTSEGDLREPRPWAGSNAFHQALSSGAVVGGASLGGGHSIAAGGEGDYGLLVR